MMATIGRSRAVAVTGRLRFSGTTAWLAWLFVHLIFLVGFRNKISVMFEWIYSYFTYKRGARVIYGFEGNSSPKNPPAEASTKRVLLSHR
jgi:NADH dehydrogenase